MEPTRSTEPRQTSEAATASPQRSPRARAALRLAPLAAIALALLLFYALGAEDYLSLEMLRHYRENLRAFVAAHAVVAPVAYLLVYVATVTVSFPGAGVLTIAGGFMFGAAFGTALAALAATIGATLVFLIARTSLGDLLARRADSRFERLRDGFRREAFSYLLFLRLVPIFPFWLVNLAAAVFRMRWLPYMAATAIGILPATFVFAWFGERLGETLEAEQPLSPQLFFALLVLGLVALLPVAVRRWRRGKLREPEAPGQS